MRGGRPERACRVQQCPLLGASADLSPYVSGERPYNGQLPVAGRRGKSASLTAPRVAVVACVAPVPSPKAATNAPTLLRR